jgi:hypothetical protein
VIFLRSGPIILQTAAGSVWISGCPTCVFLLCADSVAAGIGATGNRRVLPSCEPVATPVSSGLLCLFQLRLLRPVRCSCSWICRLLLIFLWPWSSDGLGIDLCCCHLVKPATFAHLRFWSPSLFLLSGAKSPDFWLRFTLPSVFEPVAVSSVQSSVFRFWASCFHFGVKY